MIQGESANDVWVKIPKTRPDARIRLFCFPYGGGGPGVFRSWPQILPEWIEVCAIHLPGRETRLPEPAFRRLDVLVEAAQIALRPWFDRPFALFGHSMGALVAFELARGLRATPQPLTPVHLFVSAMSAPQQARTWEPVHHLPDAEFVERIRGLAGTPEQVLAHPELMRLLTPTLRADFEVCETYQYQAQAPLACPITAFAGTDDAEVPVAGVEAWRAQTTAHSSVHIVSGGHFFLQSEATAVLRLVTEALTNPGIPGA